MGVLAKVETRLACRNWEAILEEADGIIISRGNLGMTMPIAAVWRCQKEMISAANLAGKPSFSAPRPRAPCGQTEQRFAHGLRTDAAPHAPRMHAVTRVLDSMTSSPRPTRAEATDVANAVLDGIDGFLLGAETVRGLFPVEVVATLTRIALEAEKVFSHRSFFDWRMDALHSTAQARISAPRRLPRPVSASKIEGLDLRASMASTLVRVSEKTASKLICVFTKTGRHAQEVALWRPGVPILALFQPTLSSEDGVSWVIRGGAEARRALLLRGVLPVLADPSDGLNEDAMLVAALQLAQSARLVAVGDSICLSHKLRGDISISVIEVGAAACRRPLDKTASTAVRSSAAAGPTLTEAVCTAD